MKIRIIVFASLLGLILSGCSSEKTIIIAHRGASSVAPENCPYEIYEEDDEMYLINTDTTSTFKVTLVAYEEQG